MSDSISRVFKRVIKRRKGKARDDPGAQPPGPKELGLDPSSRQSITPSPEHQQTLGLNLLTVTTVEERGIGSASGSYPVDIVALHGITGDAFDTWTAPNDVLWLRDFLPQDLPGARVFSYGYDASVFFTRAAGDIDSFARTLLESIKQRRSGEVSPAWILGVTSPTKLVIVSDPADHLCLPQHGRPRPKKGMRAFDTEDFLQH